MKKNYSQSAKLKKAMSNRISKQNDGIKEETMEIALANNESLERIENDNDQLRHEIKEVKEMLRKISDFLLAA